MRAFKRLQVNFYVEPLNFFDAKTYFPSLTPAYMPVGWFEEVSTSPSVARSLFDSD